MTPAYDQVELLDPVTERPVATADKLAAHRDGSYHRAFSILLVDTRDRHLLHRRAAVKYHCAGMWANACCSHPAPGETSRDAAHRRLGEELGVSCDLFRLGTIRYRATVPALERLGGTLVENERVALFCGRWTGGELAPDPAEVEETRTFTHDLALGIPKSETAPWLGLYLDRFARDLPAIVRSCTDKTWQPADFGTFLLD